MYRLFVAIDFPEKLKQRLSIMGCGIPGAKWVESSMLHLTLRFIGEIASFEYADVKDVLDEVAFHSFSIRLSGVGFFPPRGRPKVLWIGVEKDENLQQLHRKIETTLVGIGLKPERRKYSPHLTLARLKNSPSSKVGNFLSQHSLFMSSDILVDHFSLYSSVLGTRGAKHFIEQRYQLG